MTDSRTRNNENVLYIYDSISTKANKEREILREYGYEIRKTESMRRAPGEGRPFGVDFAEEQSRRARPHRRHMYGTGSTASGRTVRNDGSYQYRPQAASAFDGDTVVIEKNVPLRLVLEKVINLFETIEERGKNDVRIAKQRAIMQKKWSENKHNIITALILVLVTILIFEGIYSFCFVVKDIDVYGSSRYSAEEIALASGIEKGDKLYSFRASGAESAVTFACPYIKIADVSRMVPDNVSIAVEEDQAAYYANVWGDVLELSPTLRVLGTTNKESARESGLTELVLPAVKYSVAGRVIEFDDEKNERLVRNVLAKVSESTAGKNGEINSVDLTDEYNITIKAGGIYSLKLGTEADLDLKLRMYQKTVTSGGLESGAAANIDLTKVGEACVKYDFNTKNG